MYRVVVVHCLFVFIFSCAENKMIRPAKDVLSFGSPETLDIITWNIQNFPKHDSTLNYLLQIIPIIDSDIIALQEIVSVNEFNSLINGLDNYNGIIASSASYNINLAFLYSNNLDIISVNEIFEDDWWAFPRSPLVAKIEWGTQDVYIINNHFKANESGTEDEARRKSASEKLENYINEYLMNENVIILGDLNDELQEDSSKNVFQNFIKDSINYKFVDLGIAFGSSTNWSYPGWPSHLDHILITNELFDEFKNPKSKIETIQVDDYFDGGWNEYYNFISDHRAVGLCLYFIP